MSQNKKRCRICKSYFRPFNSMQFVCGTKCAVEYAQIKRYKDEKKKISKRKEELKTLSEWLKEAQSALNAFVRVRDHELPCISCQRHHQGQYHAGHYRTTKAASQLRFNLFGVNKQCQPCNSHLSGNITEYRINLVKKIGVERVEWLETNNDQRRYSVEYAKRVKKIFSKRARLYKKLKGIN